MTLDELLKAVNVSDRLPDVDREPTFRAMCDFVLKRGKEVDNYEFTENPTVMNTPVTIVETGCVRQVDDYTAGYSTVIFDKLARAVDATFVSVDITHDHVELALTLVEHRDTQVVCQNSLTFLNGWYGPIDLLYLDSYDLNVNDPHPSALHHLMELALAWPHLRRPAMVAVDDNFSGEYRSMANRYRGSKGQYVRQFFDQLGIKPMIDLHQTIWMVP